MIKDSTTALPFLNWNPQKNCFEIEDSTDRKIITFLFDRVMPTCYFEHDRFLKNYNWIEKKITHVKSAFLQEIEQEFQEHLNHCPEETYSVVLKTFHQELKQKIYEADIGDKGAKETALWTLRQLCTYCFKKIFNKPPLNIPQVFYEEFQESNSDYLSILNSGQCFHFAFYMAKEYQALLSMKSIETAACSAFLLYPKLFLQKLSFRETKTPVKDDLVLFLGDPKVDNNLRFKHLGIFTENNKIKSSWGSFNCQFEHEVSQVPNVYGSEVIFYHKTQIPSERLNHISDITNKISATLIKVNSQFIPTVLSNLGALSFLIDEFKCLYGNVNPQSKQWNWEEMRENLFAAIKYSQLKRNELIKEFEAWIQDTLPKYL